MSKQSGTDVDCESEDEEEDEVRQGISETKKRKMVALYQILYFILHNRRRRTPLRIMNAQAIHEASKSKTLITSFNHFSLSVSYDELLRYHNDLAKLTVKSSRGNVHSPSHFDPGNFTTAAFDNFDHKECTSSGNGGTHDRLYLYYFKTNQFKDSESLKYLRVP